MENPGRRNIQRPGKAAGLEQGGGVLRSLVWPAHSGRAPWSRPTRSDRTPPSDPAKSNQIQVDQGGSDLIGPRKGIHGELGRHGNESREGDWNGNHETSERHEKSEWLLHSGTYLVYERSHGAGPVGINRTKSGQIQPLQTVGDRPQGLREPPVLLIFRGGLRREGEGSGGANPCRIGVNRPRSKQIQVNPTKSYQIQRPAAAREFVCCDSIALMGGVGIPASLALPGGSGWVFGGSERDSADPTGDATYFLLSCDGTSSGATRARTGRVR